MFRPGDPSYDLVVIETGWIEIVSPATCDEPEAVVATYGPDGFLEELTFLVRRDLLRDSPAAGGIELVGSGLSAEALALRTYAARQRLPYLWLDARVGASPSSRAARA